MEGLKLKLEVLQLISSGEKTQLGIVEDIRILMAKNCGCRRAKDVSDQQIWNFLIDLLSHGELKSFLGQELFSLSEEVDIADAIALLVCYIYARLQRGFMDEFNLEDVD